MAIKLHLEFGGVVLASIPIEVTPSGYHIRGLISAAGSEGAQIVHLWRATKDGALDSGPGAINSAVDQPLRVILQADTAEEIPDSLMVGLRQAVVRWLYLAGEGGTGAAIAQAMLETPAAYSFISQAEFEAPTPLRAVISQAEFEAPINAAFLSQVELEIPVAYSFISQAEFEAPVAYSFISQAEFEAPVAYAFISAAELQIPG